MAIRNKNQLHDFFDHGFHLESRTIYLGPETNGHTFEKVLKGLHLLVLDNQEKPITIHMNNCGGDVFDGFATYDAIKSCPCQVVIEVFGQASSMGSIILQAADRRIIHQNAIVMIHDGMESFEGDPRSFENWARFSKKILRPRTYQIYSNRSGKDELFWERKCASDYIMTAEEAVELGLADEIKKQFEPAKE